MTDLNTAGGTNLIPSQLNILYYSSNVNEDCDLSNNTPANGSFGFISSSVVGAIAKAMSAKNPDATPAELQESALNLLREIAGEGKETKAASQQQQQQQREKAGSFDWDNWIAQ